MKLCVSGPAGYLFGPGGLVVAAGRLILVVVQLLLVLRRSRRLLLLLQRHQVRPLLLQLPLQPLGLPLLLDLLPLVLLHRTERRQVSTGRTAEIKTTRITKSSNKQARVLFSRPQLNMACVHMSKEKPLYYFNYPARLETGAPACI